jgi:hypothetical protein
MFVDGGPLGFAKYLIVDSINKTLTFSIDPQGQQGVIMNFP